MGCKYEWKNNFSSKKFTAKQKFKICISKNTYQTERLAKGAAERLSIVSGETIPNRPYKCPICLLWHLTSKRGNE